MNTPPETGPFGVKVYFAGLFANQLFHYCVGKILAEKYELEFQPPPAFLNRAWQPVEWSAEPVFVMRPTEGRVYPEQKVFHFGAYNWYDFDSLPWGRPLHVCHGFWCRYELYRAWKQRIKEEWLPIPENRFVAADPDALYIHVRRTDFVKFPDQEGPIDPKIYYTATKLDDFARCLDQFTDYKRLVIVTDAPDDEFHEGFRQFGIPIEISRGRWDEDFLLLASCRQLLMSTSTFSWWAGFLGRAEKIVCPTPTDCHWGMGLGARGLDREHLGNLYVDDEPGRWIFLP